MIIPGVKDKDAYKRGRDSATHLIETQGYKRAKEVIEACIEPGDDSDFDRGAEAVLRERSIR